VSEDRWTLTQDRRIAPRQDINFPPVVAFVSASSRGCPMSLWLVQPSALSVRLSPISLFRSRNATMERRAQSVEMSGALYNECRGGLDARRRVRAVPQISQVANVRVELILDVASYDSIVLPRLGSEGLTADRLAARRVPDEPFEPMFAQRRDDCRNDAAIGQRILLTRETQPA
jgi:hypothetical protein